jgi:hypothetical protein
MLSVILLSVVMLNVVASVKGLFYTIFYSSNWDFRVQVKQQT